MDTMIGFVIYQSCGNRGGVLDGCLCWVAVVWVV